MKYFKVKLSFICIILLGLNFYESRVASTTSVARTIHNIDFLYATNPLQMDGLSRHSWLWGETNKIFTFEQIRYRNSSDMGFYLHVNMRILFRIWFSRYPIFNYVP